MSDIVAAAVIAALACLVGSVLTFMVGVHQIKRSVSTSSGSPLGPALDRRLESIELRLGHIEDSLGHVRERLAFEEGRSWRTPLSPRGPD